MRDHFVYRAFDERDILLYVGCTKSPRIRWGQHKVSSPWAQYASRFRLIGPYNKTKAFEVEKSLIESEAPFFNATREDRSASKKRHALGVRLIGEAKAAKPELFGQPMSPALEAELDRLAALADAMCPPRDATWREAQYLNERRRRTVRPA